MVALDLALGVNVVALLGAVDRDGGGKVDNVVHQREGEEERGGELRDDAKGDNLVLIKVKGDEGIADLGRVHGANVGVANADDAGDLNVKGTLKILSNGSDELILLGLNAGGTEVAVIVLEEGHEVVDAGDDGVGGDHRGARGHVGEGHDEFVDVLLLLGPLGGAREGVGLGGEEEGLRRLEPLHGAAVDEDVPPAGVGGALLHGHVLPEDADGAGGAVLKRNVHLHDGVVLKDLALGLLLRLVLLVEGIELGGAHLRPLLDLALELGGGELGVNLRIRRHRLEELLSVELHLQLALGGLLGGDAEVIGASGAAAELEGGREGSGGECGGGDAAHCC